MFPPKLGIEMGQHTWLGFFGFFLSAVILPMLGLLAIVVFDGSYQRFFGRLKFGLGHVFIFLSMLIIGPLVVMPRIVVLSYTMLKSFLPGFVSLFIFSVGFSLLAFGATYRPGRLLDIIGKFLSPLKVLSLLIIVLVGIFSGAAPEPVDATPLSLFMKAFYYGYMTLDVLGAIFFGHIIVTLLTKYASESERLSMKDAIKVTAFAGVVAGALLGAVYLGMTLLGAYHGQGLGALDEAEVFAAVVMRVLSSLGAAFVGATVFLACFTTNVSLAAVVGEYAQSIIGSKYITFAQAVAAVLTCTVIIAQVGLVQIKAFSMPILLFLYPLIIVITLCNLAYKLFGFRYITAPVAITAVILVIQKLMNMWS